MDLSFEREIGSIQSRLNLHTPDIPELSYIKTMCLPAVLVDEPKRVLFLGMGGGSLPKFWIDNFPNSDKTIVDIRPKLFGIAQEFFQFVPDLRTKMINEDASQFTLKASNLGQKYDVIYTDIFIEGPADIQNNEYFWKQISECLAPGGVSCANIWVSGEHEEKALNIIEFHRRNFNTVFKILNSETSQIALCGTNQSSEELMSVKKGIRAIELTAPTNINFTRMLGSNTKVI